MVTELVIAYLGDKDGYRIVTKQNPTTFDPNPTVKIGQTVRWQSPKDEEACIVILAESPFARNGDLVTREVLEISAGGISEELQIDNNATIDQEYEYAVLVRGANSDYTYVRGAASPPGVIVGGP